MQLEIRVRSANLTEALRSYIDRRLRFALGRFAHRVSKVTVRVSDVNGRPSGGPSKRCWMDAELMPSDSVGATVTDRHLYVAIDGAADRIGRSVARKLGKVRRLGRFAKQWSNPDGWATDGNYTS